MSNGTPNLDFEALLSRDYRPARVTRLIPREKYKPHHHTKQQLKSSDTSKRGELGAQDSSASTAAVARQQAQETSRLVLSLVTQTPAFSRHLPPSERERTRQTAADLLTDQLHVTTSSNGDYIPPSFHEVELGDWESKINWQGCPDEDENENDEKGTTESNTFSASESREESSSATSKVQESNAMALLKRPRNPFLDQIRFDESTVCWDGDPSKLLEKARSAPLILELGVAGTSVAKHVYQNTVLSAQRPKPALDSEEYRQRMEKDWAGNITSTAELSKGTLHADKDKMEAVIEARQKKRAQMAKDKTSRVQQAMSNMALGGGRGRTITSSLMGPGGTERTGRPTRASHSSAVHDREYMEQLDIVVNHTLVRDLSKVLLREYHRPKLPMSVVRQDLSWQLQIRFLMGSPKGKEAGAGGAAGTSYQAMMMGTHAGALSKAKMRSEADLSPSEGHLILVEYCEERPPLQLTKGMGWKLVNYFRGDRARCPVSRGGGDRPARRKRETADATAISSSRQLDRLPRLNDSRETNIMDWVGKLPKKSQRTEKEAIDILPEGVTEMLHPKVHGPFIGEISEGMTVSGLISNLFVAPVFCHEPESTDFLLILTTPGGASRAGQRERMGVVLREIPASLFTVGQIEPRTRVYAPNTQGEKSFVGPFVSYQIARAIARTQAREGHGLRFDELQDRVLPNLELPPNALRQRLKQVAIYDKNTQIWTNKPIGYEEYPGVEALGKLISPEGVAAFETASATSRRLSDLGIHQLLERGSHTVVSAGVAMVYLAGQLNATRELSRKVKKFVELSRTNKSVSALQTSFYEKAANDLDVLYKTRRQKYEVAQFIYEELQLASWHLTGEFIDVHKKGEGTGMMKLTGLGDPSGKGEGFSFLREADSKPSKSVGNAALSAQVKKITGTEDDLRKLTMKQMASLLRSYGMAQKQIDTLRRWDRVHVIRDLSTKAASDGIGDGLERFARGEKLKLSEQRQMYRDRLQVIWKRQIAALSADSGDKSTAVDGGPVSRENEVDDSAVTRPDQSKAANDTIDDSDEDSEDDDDLAAALEDEMMDRTETNQLVAAHAQGNEGDVGQLRAAAQDKEMTKDARELAALKRQREEERVAQEGLQSLVAGDEGLSGGLLQGLGRKVIRKRITRTHPDGRQITTFKFVLHPEEVGKIMDRLHQNPDHGQKRTREFKYEYAADEKPPGHAMFEDEDDFEYSSKGRFHAGGRRGGGRRRGAGGRSTPRGRNLQLGKLKTRVSKEERMRKRKREEEELEVYATAAKRKGTNNRRERGSIRDRRPHVIYAEKLESIRAAVEARPYAGPFMKPVNSRIIPRYYEVISHPIDLQTIRERIAKYEYRSADVLLRDFELMKNNAIKFNGQGTPIAQEATAIYDYVKDKIESNRSELTSLEQQVEDQMSGKPQKKKKSGTKKSSSATSTVAKVHGVNVHLGDLGQSGLSLDGSESDSDESYSGLLNL